MTRTLKVAAITAIAAALTLTACGDDGEGDAGLSEAQSAAAQSAIDSASEDGVTLDEDCVNEVAAQLTEEDAALAAADDDAELSPAGEALTIQLISCADSDELVDLFIAGLAESGPALDEDCAREQLEEFDVVEALTAAGGDGDLPEGLIEALTPCFGG
jgi:hypothetical protein